MGKKKHTLEYVDSKFEEEGWTLLESEYKNSKQKLECLCPEGHLQYKSYNSFLKGNRCSNCYGNNKYTIEEIKEYTKKEGIITTSDLYINKEQKLDMYCIKSNHKFQMTWGNFKNLNNRCFKCFHKNNYGHNHPNWNPDRTRQRRIRYLILEKRNFDISKLKNDPLYSKYIKNRKKYHIDHIFPRKAFIDHDIDKKYGLEYTKKICNDIENLQILEKNKNLSKGSTYNEMDFLFYVQRKNIEHKILGIGY